MRATPMAHNTVVNPFANCDHDEYLKAIGYTYALRQFSGNVANYDNYRATYPHNAKYRIHTKRMRGRIRYWRNRVDDIIREHSCHKCNCWTGTYYLHADNMWSSQQAKPEYICDACMEVK